MTVLLHNKEQWEGKQSFLRVFNCKTDTGTPAIKDFSPGSLKELLGTIVHLYLENIEKHSNSTETNAQHMDNIFKLI